MSEIKKKETDSETNPEKATLQDEKSPAAGADSETGDMSIEESFAALDAMVKKLEDEDISLEDSFRTYEEGMKLLKSVNEKVCGVEKKMQELDGEGQIGDFK